MHLCSYTEKYLTNDPIKSFNICAQRLCRSVAPTYEMLNSIVGMRGLLPTNAGNLISVTVPRRDLSECKPTTNEMKFAPVVSKLMEDTDGKQN